MMTYLHNQLVILNRMDSNSGKRERKIRKACISMAELQSWDYVLIWLMGTRWLLNHYC